MKGSNENEEGKIESIYMWLVRVYYLGKRTGLLQFSC